LNSNSNSNSNSNNRHNYILFDPKDLLTNKKRQENQFVLPFSLGDGLEVKLSDVTEEDEQPQEEEKEVECFSPTSVLSNDNQAEEKAQIQAEIHSSKDLIVEDVRKKVIQEICTTEKTYVSCIRTLYASYIVPLEETSHPIIQDAQIAVFFNNLRQLVMLNSKLLNDLTEILKQREEKIKKDRVFKGHLLTKTIALQVEGVGEMFCRYAPLFKLYSGYAKDYEDVARLLVGYKKDTRLGFAAFLEKCQKRSNCEKSFESLLILPIQRIPRYKLLLERLLRHTPNGHFDKVYLTEAVSRVAFATSLINETVRRQENLEMLLQTQMQFMGQMSLFNPERSLVKSGKLTKISTKKQEQVVLHLFNDILLYSAIVSLTGGYRIRRVVHLNSRAVHVSDQVPLTHTALLIASKNLKHDCGFVVASKEKTFILFTSTSEEKKEWVNCLQKTITDSQAKFSINPISANNKSTSHEISGGTKGPSDLLLVQETPSDAAALWVPDAVAGACTICHAGFKLYFRRHHCR
jgi:FYVE/RhoGEF/PH domain-containing protein 5/6